MVEKESELIWKALHKELPLIEQQDLLESLGSDVALNARYNDCETLHEGLQASHLSEEAWLEGVTNRILQQMENEENHGRLSFVQRRVAQWGAIAALLILGLFSFSLWNGPSSLSWEKPEIVSSQFRGSLSAGAMISEESLLAWNKAFEAQVNKLHSKQHLGQASAWSLEVTFQGVDEGVSVEVSAWQAQSMNPIRTWTFFASDLSVLNASRKGWAEDVVRGIIANDP